MGGGGSECGWKEEVIFDTVRELSTSGDWGAWGEEYI